MIGKHFLIAGLAASSTYAAQSGRGDEKSAEAQPSKGTLEVNVRRVLDPNGINMYSDYDKDSENIPNSYSASWVNSIATGSFFCIEEVSDAKNWYQVITLKHELPVKDLFVYKKDILDKTSAGEFRKVTTTKIMKVDGVRIPAGSRLSVNISSVDFDAIDYYPHRMLTILRGTDSRGRQLECNGLRVTKANLIQWSNLEGSDQQNFLDEAVQNGICRFAFPEDDNGSTVHRRFNYYFVRCKGTVYFHWDATGHYNNGNAYRGCPNELVQSFEKRVAENNFSNKCSGLAKITGAEIDKNRILTLSCEQTIQIEDKSIQDLSIRSDVDKSSIVGGAQQHTANIFGESAIPPEMFDFIKQVRAAEPERRSHRHRSRRPKSGTDEKLSICVKRTIKKELSTQFMLSSINETFHPSMRSKFTLNLMKEQLEQLGIHVEDSKAKGSNTRRLLRASCA